VSVDNRYTGVGYEPPIHTEPLDTGRYVLIEDYQELEAERDRLKAGLEYQKSIEEQMDVINKGLRARHAALVELASGVLKIIDSVPGVRKHDALHKLKAALAEVKG